MRKLLTLMMLFSILLASCEKGKFEVPQESSKLKSLGKDYPDSIKLGEYTGVASVITYNETLLKQALSQELNANNITDIEIQNYLSYHYLKGTAEFSNDSVLAFGIQIYLNGDNDYILQKAGCKQGCRSKNGCTGSELIIVSDCAGFCNCIKHNIYKDPSNGECEHNISSATNINEELIALLYDLIDE